MVSYVIIVCEWVGTYLYTLPISSYLGNEFSGVTKVVYTWNNLRFFHI